MTSETQPTDELDRALVDAGQEHLLESLHQADGPIAERLRAELAEVDLALVSTLRAQLAAEAPAAATDFAPPEMFPLTRAGGQGDEARAASQRGAELLSSGSVGFLLVAGGQASRLGYDGPKGAYPLGPVTGRTLFDWHASRIRAAARRHGFRPLWLVMTSRANDATTRQVFADNRHFGLDPEDVVFFSQAMLPALDREGRILRAAPDALFLAPNGHGGSLEALARSGALATARERGIRHLSYFQVDNPLARPADPLFLGLHAGAGARMSSKVVAKRDPGEKVGVIGRMDGELSCIEYLDLPDSLRDARDGEGELLFRAGNIAVHLIDVDFIDELTRDGLELPWHVAKKRMQVVDPAGAPAEVDGVKFETFVFDALARSGASVTLEVDRALEFSPVKNREGSDSPATSRADLGRLFAGWAEASGRPAPPSASDGGHAVEVDPLLAEDLGEFQAAGPPEPREVDGGHLYAAPE
ncbi:MAG: UTP--glucose-1-phosphate uridylyltransferase [Planctomycetota bacterium]